MLVKQWTFILKCKTKLVLTLFKGKETKVNTGWKSTKLTKVNNGGRRKEQRSKVNPVWHQPGWKRANRRNMRKSPHRNSLCRASVFYIFNNPEIQLWLFPHRKLQFYMFWSYCNWNVVCCSRFASEQSRASARRRAQLTDSREEDKMLGSGTETETGSSAGILLI